MTQSEADVPDTQVRGKQWVRSFLFSVKIDSPLARLHVMSKLFAILLLSLVIVRFIDTESPDPVGSIIMILLAFLGLYLSGVLHWVFGSYLVIMFPGLFGMAFAWTVFNPSLGGNILVALPLYSGTITLGLSFRLFIFLAYTVGWYVWRKGVFWGIVGGVVVSLVVTSLVGNPSITFAQFELGQPIWLSISTQNLIVGTTKALGYGAMMLVSMMLVMTSRDIEIIGVMRQFRIPYVASFFTATMLRSLSMAIFDYSTIRQAQIARGISLKKKNIFRMLADLAYMAVPLTATMLRRSTEIGDAALIRGFTMSSKDPTEFHEVRPFRVADWIVVALCSALAGVVLVLDINFTVLLFGTVL